MNFIQQICIGFLVAIMEEDQLVEEVVVYIKNEEEHLDKEGCQVKLKSAVSNNFYGLK